MPDYKQGKIYKLINSIDDKIYVGSTCNLLSQRKAGHKTSMLKQPTQTVYAHFNSIGWDKVDIVLIEEIECENKMQLFQRERHYIDLLKPALNKIRPVITIEEQKENKKQWVIISNMLRLNKKQIL
jgi:hypothetical protein